MADKTTRDLITGALVVGGVAGIMWMYARGKTPAVHLNPVAFGNTYDPYMHFLHQSPGAWLRHYPAQVAPNCLPMIYQNEDIGKAVAGFEVDNAGSAQ